YNSERDEFCAALLVADIVTGAGGRSPRHVVRAPAAMRPAAPARRGRAATAAFIGALTALGLRLRARDGGGQTSSATGGLRLRLLLLRLILRLRTVLALLTVAAMFARLLLVALIGLLVAIALVVVAHIGLRLLLLRHEARLLAERREAVVLALGLIRRHVVVGARLLHVLRLVLAGLLLRGRDQAEVMLGVLVVVLGGHRVAGGARIAGELDVFLGDMGGGAADLDVRSVRFVDPGHRVLAAPVVVIVVVPVAHPLVVLTVSHVSPLFQPYEVNFNCHSHFTPSPPPNHAPVE